MITVESAKFTDVLGMPQVHVDARRVITEFLREGGLRVTRIEVTGMDVVLGNHHHTFEERFSGAGGGTLYTAPATALTAVTRHVLPEDGWEVNIPPGVVHAFVVSVGCVIVSRTDRHFVSVDNQDQHPDQPVNTHAVRLI